MQIYDGAKYDKYNVGSSSYLQINSCGIQTIEKEDLLSLRAKGRVDYLILYLSAGSAQVKYGETTYDLKPGDFVLYPPDMPQWYKIFRNSKTIFLHFNGFCLPEIMVETQITYGVHRNAAKTIPESAFLRLISENNLGLPVSNEKGLLLSLLYTIGKAENARTTRYGVIEECIMYMVENANKKLTVAQLARMCFVSESRFMHLFKKATGKSPHAYLQSLKTENAKMLLTSTTFSISEISGMVGIDDPLYFSRIFKKATGTSPRTYRTEYRDS